MDYKICYKPSYAMAVINMVAGESIYAESGSMVGNSGNFNIKTSMSMNPNAGFAEKLIGLPGIFARKIFGGESLFVNNYSVTEGAGQIMLSPSLTGDIVHKRLDGNSSFFIQASSYLASTTGISLSTKWAGIRGLLSGEGLFLLQTEGGGSLFINCHGAIYEHDIDGAFIVDTGHVVAFEDTLNYSIRRVGGWKSTFFSGEGLVTEFSGKGKLYLQTRNLNAFLSWLTPMLPS